jgi:hypothetical protein
MPRDDGPAPEEEALHVLSELQEHEEELAQLLKDVRESRERLSGLVRSMRARQSMNGSKTHSVH